VDDKVLLHIDIPVVVGYGEGKVGEGRGQGGEGRGTPKTRALS